MADGEFSKSTIETLAKRAGNFCSNPDCTVLTCGPAETDERSVTIGEAAHIFGRLPGSTRFRDDLTTAERADITNAIWLCRNCHKLVDADAARYQAALLFEWRREHERYIAEQLGRRGDAARQRLLDRELASFKNTSYLARQIVIDKPEYWEFKLAAELLRTGFAEISSRYNALELGLYAKLNRIVRADHVLDWNRARTDDLVRQLGAIKQLATDELAKAWGAPGVAGDELEILRVCMLLVEAAEHLLAWEESVRFSSLPKSFADYQTCLAGATRSILKELQKIPEEVSSVFQEDSAPHGERNINLVFTLPDQFSERAIAAFQFGLREEGLV